MNDETIGYVLIGFNAETCDHLVVMSDVESENIDVFVYMLAASVMDKYVYAGCLQERL